MFSGIGGFALAARWMNWETVQFVEIDPFCQAVLRKNFNGVPIHGDIKTFNGESLRGTIDILTGGFPCQPYSTAGQGKGTADDRHLWPEMRRVIGEVQPRWIVGENVSGLLSWNGGLVLKQIQIDLENQGFTMFPPAVLPACGVNAPHRRDRVWIIARSTKRFSNHENSSSNGTHKVQEKRFDEPESTTNPDRIRQPRPRQPLESVHTKKDRAGQASWSDDVGTWPTEPPVRIGNDGLSIELVRCAIHGAGNAIVPQVALEIYKAIEATMKA